ncbi:GGDEF domain protein [Vibrio mediterranei AK1]|uniref:DEAD/DEAH box helicase n=1 Tax=Vibrio mediterranei TaxID=689 RepID=UPI0001540F00|nr:DEAD/DEAH box helicase family protein [Vibrio mediterranei]EDL54007.1 GGDEF domain protein [Vibrio mediterranei AK1]
MLRIWQAEGKVSVITKYSSIGNHYFCQATPGAGKTVFAAEVAKRLLELDMVDIILCLAPSKQICDGIRETFSKRLAMPFDGGLGSIGQAMTYQSIHFKSEDFWINLERKRLFVVFDEIHHCSGNETSLGNVWGQVILNKISRLANYTLALSGTPWRSDHVPIVLSNYTDSEGKLVVDYQYSLKQAVADKVCRSPKIVLIDNDRLSVKGEEGTESFRSILDYVKRSNATYQSLLYNDEALSHILRLGCEKLHAVRQHSQRAAGLVVAASVAHAKLIYQKLTRDFKQSATIVTYKSENPREEIERFRKGNAQWIVSVGMVSEGTDIPRLQVCCHLSTITTELYFRQVLGRILRLTDSPNQDAWLFTFAEERLSEFAERIEEDIPDSCLYLRETEEGKLKEHTSKEAEITTTINTALDQLSKLQGLIWNESMEEDSVLARDFSANELKLGNFRQRVISCFISTDPYTS